MEQPYWFYYALVQCDNPSSISDGFHQACKNVEGIRHHGWVLVPSLGKARRYLFTATSDKDCTQEQLFDLSIAVHQEKHVRAEITNMSEDAPLQFTTIIVIDTRSTLPEPGRTYDVIHRILGKLGHFSANQELLIISFASKDPQEAMILSKLVTGFVSQNSYSILATFNNW